MVALCLERAFVIRAMAAASWQPGQDRRQISPAGGQSILAGRAFVPSGPGRAQVLWWSHDHQSDRYAIHGRVSGDRGAMDRAGCGRTLSGWNPYTERLW